MALQKFKPFIPPTTQLTIVLSAKKGTPNPTLIASKLFFTLPGILLISTPPTVLEASECCAERRRCEYEYELN
tara:strand:- start:581 stop:799 length:219 start_codon:yes stop_codon:yes gene_type:complete